jgi:hypothetical protein
MTTAAKRTVSAYETRGIRMLRLAFSKLTSSLPDEVDELTALPSLLAKDMRLDG